MNYYIINPDRYNKADQIQLSLTPTSVPTVIVTPRELGFTEPMSTQDLLYDEDRQRAFGKQLLGESLTIGVTSPEVLLQYSWQYTDQPVGERLWGATKLIKVQEDPKMILLEHSRWSFNADHPSSIEIALRNVSLSQRWELDAKFLWEIIPV